MEQDKRGPADGTEQSAGAASAHQDAAADELAGARSDADLIAKLSAEVEALRADNTEQKDKALRLMAEMENLRRRTEREKSEFSKYAISEFARDVISVGDNIRRAIEAVPKDAASHDTVLRSLVEGVEVTERELLKALEKYQIKRFDPQGEPFNPHMHDAMTKIEVPNVPADTVVQVIHAGYMIGERVLRPAAVIVAKGSETSEKPKPPAKDDDKDEPVPPGAMKVPEELASSPEPQQQEAQPPRSGRPDVQHNVLGREFQAERRRQGQQPGGSEERTAPFRRPRSAAGDQSFTEVRQNNGPSNNKPSTLHKPVIGSRND